MRKSEVLDYFGGTNLTAHAMGVTAQAIEKWPENLSEALEAKVIVKIMARDGYTKARRAFPETLGPAKG